MSTNHRLLSPQSPLSHLGRQALFEHWSTRFSNQLASVRGAPLPCRSLISQPLSFPRLRIFVGVLLAYTGVGFLLPAAGSASTPISDAAYPLLLQRTFTNRQAFFVYKDEDSWANHGFPSGFFGAIQKIHVDTSCIDDPSSATGGSTNMAVLDRQRGNVVRVTFDPLVPGEYAGLNFEEPENWGILRTGVGYDLTGATQLVVCVRCPTPGGISVQFGVAGSVSPFYFIPQSTNYQTISFDLSAVPGSALANEHILLSVAVSVDVSPSSGTLLIDWVKFLPVPPSQTNVLGFPLATDTFGVVPRNSPATNRQPWPLDQVLRNLSTPYESALTALALLRRGASNDLNGAKIILDSFV